MGLCGLKTRLVYIEFQDSQSYLRDPVSIIVMMMMMKSDFKKEDSAMFSHRRLTNPPWAGRPELLREALTTAPSTQCLQDELSN